MNNIEFIKKTFGLSDLEFDGICRNNRFCDFSYIAYSYCNSGLKPEIAREKIGGKYGDKTIIDLMRYEKVSNQAILSIASRLSLDKPRAHIPDVVSK